jgi:hypothetical protein
MDAKEFGSASKKPVHNPMAICNGCGISVKRSGLLPHLRLSGDLRCQRELQKHRAGDGELSSDSNMESVNSSAIVSDSAVNSRLAKSVNAIPSISIPSVFGPALARDEPKQNFSMQVDVAGDFFGDYQDYSLSEFGTEEAHEGLDLDDSSEGSSEEEIDDMVDAILAEEEHGLEPNRPTSLQTSSDQPDDEIPVRDDITQEKAARLRGGYEEKLKNQPFVVKFTRGNPGAVVSRGGHDENTRYSSAVGNSDNPYAPFASKMEWDIARWAKLWGPSSTAFTELMGIQGVSFIT